VNHMPLKQCTALLFVLLLFSVGGPCCALEISYGMKGELLFCGFTGEHPNLKDYSGQDSNGIALGSYARISYRNILSIQPELLLALKGDQFKSSVTGERINLTQLYLEIPVLFSVSFPLPTSIPIAPRIGIGPYWGVHLFSTGEATDFDLDINPFDFGVVIGYGVDVRRFSFDISHSVGLTAVSGNLRYDTHFLTIGFRIIEKKSPRENRRNLNESLR
jgi:hypothetical protein